MHREIEERYGRKTTINFNKLYGWAGKQLAERVPSRKAKL